MKQEFIIDFIIRKPAKSFFKKHENIKEKFKNNIILHFKGQRNIDIKKLIGYSDLFRMRINSYRVIYKVINNKIILIDVIDADNRGDIYQKELLQIEYNNSFLLYSSIKSNSVYKLIICLANSS